MSLATASMCCCCAAIPAAAEYKPSSILIPCSKKSDRGFCKGSPAVSPYRSTEVIDRKGRGFSPKLPVPSCQFPDREPTGNWDLGTGNSKLRDRGHRLDGLLQRLVDGADG